MGQLVQYWTNFIPFSLLPKLINQGRLRGNRAGHWTESLLEKMERCRPGDNSQMGLELAEA